MAGPITWRNVNGGIDPAAVRLLENSQSSINTGLGGLGKIVDQQQAARTANNAQLKTNNTNTILDTLSKFKNVGEFNAADQAGQIEALKTSMGPRVDTRAIQGAVNALPAQLMAKENAQNTFDDNARDRALIPILEQGNSLNITGDDAGRAEWRQRNSVALAAAGKLASFDKSAADQDRSETIEGRQDTQYDQSQVAYGQGQEAYQRGEAARIRGEGADELVSTATSDYFSRRTNAEKKLIEMASTLGIGTNADGAIDYDKATDAQVQNLAAVAKSLGIDKPISQTDVRQSVFDTLRNDPSFKGMTSEERIAATNNLDSMLVNANSLAQGDKDLAQAELASAGQFYNITGNGYFNERGQDKAQLAVDAITEIAQTNETLKSQLGNEDKQAAIIPAVRQALENGVEVYNPETRKKDSIPLTSADVKSALLQYGEKWGEINEKNISQILTDYAKSASVGKRYTDYQEYTAKETEISNRLTSSANGQNTIDDQLARLRGALNR